MILHKKTNKHDLKKNMKLLCNVMSCISRIIYISNKPQYLKNKARYGRVGNDKHKYLTSSWKLEGFL